MIQIFVSVIYLDRPCCACTPCIVVISTCKGGNRGRSPEPLVRAPSLEVIEVVIELIVATSDGRRLILIFKFPRRVELHL